MVLAAALGLASPAYAGTGRTPDPHGDARASLDLTSAQVTLNRARLRLSVEVRDLGAAGAFTVSLYQDTEDYDTNSLHLTAYKTRSEAVRSTVGTFDRLGISPDPSTSHYDRYCPSSATWDRAADRVTVTLPECAGYDASKPVKVVVLATATKGDADRERRIVDRTRNFAFRP